ncbi:protocadherin beta-3-like [Emydura macquarii macquarii]|uniref:protocadherin beta-3-like n=1 Tax=Emydura macquarii macquarii TaxID=1129001 RepID=UPI00352A6D43
MEMRNNEKGLKRQLLSLIFFLCVSEVRTETFRYVVTEETGSGFFVTNIAKDLRLEADKLSARQARIISEGKKQYFQLDRSTGDLFIQEKIDREELCGQIDPCLVHFEILLQNPLQSYRAEVSVCDINDHSPVFLNNEFILKISESTMPGNRFLLESAQDLDVGNNSLQNYSIGSNDYFQIYTRDRSDGRKSAELVLDKPLDREEKPEISFILLAIDGGSPPRSGSAQIRVIVLDINDNNPVFSRLLYKVQVLENRPEDYLLASVSATDLDEGINGEISYSIIQNSEENRQTFKINPITGEIRLKRPLDFEDRGNYEIDVQGMDGGGLSAHCKVLVQVLDMNDNAPEVTITSHTSSISENSQPGTVIALFHVRDRDSGDNGKIVCSIEDNLPFTVRTVLKNSYSLMTESTLDRERQSEYNIRITAQDLGSPSLATAVTIIVTISDINDNSPVFNETSYTLYITENNGPGIQIGKVGAIDSDSEQNAKVTYSLLPDEVGSLPVLSYISVNSENGNVYALRSMDYEQIRSFQVAVRATDGGSPSLSSEVIVRVVIVDANDNAPFILYPLQNSSSPANDLVPRSAETGYLVTKVVTVDGDSGQNSWLSYQLLKATDPGLFSVGSQNGEIRTTRPLNERDSFKQKLHILARDNGEPPLSTTATLNLLVLDRFSNAYMQISEVPSEEEKDSTLTMYLVIALATISFIFLFSVVLFVVIKVCKRRNFSEKYNSSCGYFYGSNGFPSNLIDVSGTGTLSQTYQYEVCLTNGSGNSEFTFLRPIIPRFPAQNSEIDMVRDNDFLHGSHAGVQKESVSQERTSACVD